jgi:hypothetical protein
LEIYFLLLSGDGERGEWNCFPHDSSVEDAGNNYDIGILTGNNYDMETFTSERDIKVDMVSL